MAIAIRSILAATDRSPACDDVVRGAGALAELTGAELHVVHVLPAARGPGGENLLEMQGRIHEARAALRAEVRRKISGRPRVASVHIDVGSPSPAILKRAGDVGADLIVIGPHRTRAVGDPLLGSTADRLVRGSPIACLVVRRPLAMPIRRIVVTSDLSPAARDALAVAIGWAAALRASPTEPADLRLVHVESLDGPSRTAADERLDRWAELDREVTAAHQLAGTDRSVDVDREILHGSSPAGEILRYARESDAQMLVMSTRGEHPLVKALLGSVSAAVARKTEVPLLLVPPHSRAAPAESPEILLADPPR